MDNDKVYFAPGDLVTLKKELPNKPVMLVIRKELSLLKDKMSGENTLKGIKCRWFTNDGAMQEAIWNTKDIIKV